MKRSQSNEITLLKLDPTDQQSAICALLREYVPLLTARVRCSFLGAWRSGPYPLYCSKLRIGEVVVQINFELPTTSGEVRLWRSSQLGEALAPEARERPMYLSSVVSGLGLRGSPYGALERKDGEASEIYDVRHELEDFLLLYPAIAASPKFPDLLPIYSDETYMARMKPIDCSGLSPTP
jgi:hypothetical protein